MILDFMEKADSNTEPFSVSQARLLYRSCMATGILKQRRGYKLKVRNTTNFFLIICRRNGRCWAFAVT